MRPNHPLIVGLGEALFDCYPGRVALGGAPVNVVVHANALLSGAGAALPATRVGSDPLGDRFFREMRALGVATHGVQVDQGRATGRVEVEIDRHGNALYRFAADAAWDALALTPEWTKLAKSCQAVVFGTLAQRSPASRRAIAGFLEAAAATIRLLDVNLRCRYYSEEVLVDSLESATAVKLNAAELEEVARLVGLPGGRPTGVEEQAFALCEAFALDWLALTRGPAGTLLFRGGARHEGRVDPPSIDGSPHEERDSVGAGDACCAGLLVGSLLGWAPERTLALANRVGAYVASQPGATPPLPDSLLSSVVDGRGEMGPPA